MLRFVVRYGLIRVVGRRAVPALMLWDAAVMANRARQIPIVDRTIRRGAGAAMRGAADVAGGRYRPAATGTTGVAAPARLAIRGRVAARRAETA